MMKRHRTVRIAAHRGGMVSIEVAATIAVMVPVAGALLFLGVKICAALYQTIGALVSWPFL